ncbi:MAG: hypothetical protein O3C40_29575 [Planctomycetota bacterium]|nr:hypothetical protein [Planctomycetota bacterium]
MLKKIGDRPITIKAGGGFLTPSMRIQVKCMTPMWDAGLRRLPLRTEIQVK